MRARVSIYSRAELESLLQEGIFSDTAVICFYDINKGPMDLPLHTDSYQVAIDGPVFNEMDVLAHFIFYAKATGLKMICVCETGLSESAGCAAAIRQYYNGDGIEVFANIHYFPDKQIYQDVFNALIVESSNLGKCIAG